MLNDQCTLHCVVTMDREHAGSSSMRFADGSQAVDELVSSEHEDDTGVQTLAATENAGRLASAAQNALAMTAHNGGPLMLALGSIQLS